MMARLGDAWRGHAGRDPARRRLARAMAAFLSVAIALPKAEAAPCHHYSRWYYPWRQACAVAFVRHALHSVAASSVPNQEHPGNEARLVRLVPGPADLPLPGLARADLDGGEADEATRARLLLRAALGVPDAH